jgi:hypothetical protein
MPSSSRSCLTSTKCAWFDRLSRFADPDFCCQTFNFTLIDQINREVQGLTLATFGYNKSYTDEGFGKIVSVHARTGDSDLTRGRPVAE